MPRTKASSHKRPSEGEQALFEAGIKLGGVFHQFIGTPVAPSTAKGLARAIEAAVGLQPYVRSAQVRIRPERGGPTGTGRFGYRYLTAEMLEVDLTILVGSTEVRAGLRYRPDLRYPLMTARLPRPGRRASRSARRSR